MSREYKENYKRLINKNADKYVGGEDADLVRFSDEHLLTTNASGLGGVDIVGTPTQGQSLIYIDGQWIPGLTDASGINSVPVVGVPTQGQSLIYIDGQWIPGLTDASGINGIQIIGTPNNGEGIIYRDGLWVTALNDASGINNIAVVGSPSTNDLLKYDGTNWTPEAPSSQSQIVGAVVTDSSNGLIGGWTYGGTSSYTYRRIGRHLEFGIQLGNINFTAHSTNALQITLPSGLYYTRSGLGGSLGISGWDTARHWVTGAVGRGAGNNTAVPLIGSVAGATGQSFAILCEVIGIPEGSGTLQASTTIRKNLQTNNIIDLENDDQYHICLYGMVPILGWTETGG